MEIINVNQIIQDQKLSKIRFKESKENTVQILEEDVFKLKKIFSNMIDRSIREIQIERANPDNPNNSNNKKKYFKISITKNQVTLVLNKDDRSDTFSYDINYGKCFINQRKAKIPEISNFLLILEKIFSLVAKKKTKNTFITHNNIKM